MINYKIKNIHQPRSPLNQKLNLNSKTKKLVYTNTSLIFKIKF